MNNKSIILSSIVIIILAAGIGFWAFRSLKNNTEDSSPTTYIANFDDCAKAGYPIMESYPRQCRTPDGQLFVEGTNNPNTPDTATHPTKPVATGGCYIGGCSSQLCSDQPDMVSTCEARQEYACYQDSSLKCERQTNGKCGWTESPEFRICTNAILYPGIDMK